MNSFTLLLGVALLLQSTVANPPALPAQLRFNWPKNLTARVETEKTRERQTDSTKTTTVKASYRMRFSPHAEGFLVQHDEFRIDGVPPAQLAAASETLTAMVPNLIVDRNGDFLRVDNIATLKAAVDSFFAPLRTSGRLPEGLKDVLSQFLSEKMMTTFAAQEWQMLAASWREMPLSIEKFEVDVEEPSPFMPDVKIPMKLSGGMVGRETCPRGGGASYGCAVFEQRSAFDQTSIQTVLQRLMDRMVAGMKDLEGLKYERLDVVTVLRIRLETETMVPHELSTTKTVEMTMSHPAEGRMDVKQIDRRTSRFSY